jgi:prolyl 4-hydroxylase
MVYEYPNSFTIEDCKQLIESANQFSKADTLGEKIDDYRVAENIWLSREDKMSTRIFYNIYLKTNCLPVHMEHVCIVKYDIGGEYKLHHDFFHPSEDYSTDLLSNGGNRVKTALIYLNDDFEGGETQFPNLDTTIKPELGKMVIWDNLLDNGELDMDSIHAGLPVTSGTKYIAVVFIREKDFE